MGFLTRRRKVAPSEIAQVAGQWVAVAVSPTDPETRAIRHTWFEEHGWGDEQTYKFSFVIMGVLEVICAKEYGDHPAWPAIQDHLHKEWDGFVHEMLVTTLSREERSRALEVNLEIARRIREQTAVSFVRAMVEHRDLVPFAHSVWRMITSQTPVNALGAMENCEYLMTIMTSFQDFLQNKIVLRPD